MRITRVGGAALVAGTCLMTACSDSFTEKDLADELKKGDAIDDATADCIAAEIFDEWGDDEIAEGDILDDGELTPAARDLFTDATLACAGRAQDRG